MFLNRHPPKKKPKKPSPPPYTAYYFFYQWISSTVECIVYTEGIFQRSFSFS